MFCALGLVLDDTEGVESLIHVLSAQTHFRRYRGRRVPFSCFALPDSFSAVLRASGPDFQFCAPDSFLAVPSASGPILTFCAPRLVFDGADGVRSRFHVWRSRTRFRLYRGHQIRFHVLRSRTSFRRYRGRRVSYSCFALPDSFSALPRASGPVLTFCAPGLVFCGAEGVRSRFHVLRARSHFRRYRGRRVLFSCFACPESFSEVPMSSGPDFIF
jgi:hypothetical protein